MFSQCFTTNSYSATGFSLAITVPLRGDLKHAPIPPRSRKSLGRDSSTFPPVSPYSHPTRARNQPLVLGLSQCTSHRYWMEPVAVRTSRCRLALLRQTIRREARPRQLGPTTTAPTSCWSASKSWNICSLPPTRGLSTITWTLQRSMSFKTAGHL